VLFLRKVLCLSIRKKEWETKWAGEIEYSFCKMVVTVGTC
jgi:hypothetical protein